MTKKKKHISFDLDWITLSFNGNRVAYTVSINDGEKPDIFSDDEKWGKFYDLTVDLDKGHWALDSAGCPVWLPTEDYKAVGRFVERVLQQYGNCEVDEHNLYDKFTEEALKKVK